ncbi:MAG: ribonuclease Z, partial [Lachnospiraceae bacterium]|nr:ribonuclease Z [Lachnospiraceae bacterium]
MLDVCLLGTGGMMPLPYRFLTSLAVRYNGSTILIDCGEGTQIALRKKGWSPKPIDTICFTHFHADHISGLPGMLLNMGNAEKTEPLYLIGPKGLTTVVNSMRIIAPELPFPVYCWEIEGREASFSFGDLTINAFRVHHNVTCYGYRLSLSRQGKFDVAAAEALGLEKRYWNRLQKGENLSIDGREFTPDMVLGPPRKGLSLTYTTDTRPTQSIIDNAKEADLFICEGMYGEKEAREKAKEHKHMTFEEAALLARKAEASDLWLTHFSPS